MQLSRLNSGQQYELDPWGGNLNGGAPEQAHSCIIKQGRGSQAQSGWQWQPFRFSAVGRCVAMMERRGPIALHYRQGVGARAPNGRCNRMQQLF